MPDTRYNVCLVNSADPRGLKVGGIETYIRDYITFHPQDMDLLFIGPDEIGDLKPDIVNEIEFRGRKLKFLPISSLSNSVNQYPTKITESESFGFLKLMFQKRALIKKVLRDGKYSAELRRVEFAPFFTFIGVPFVQMLHVWGDKDKPMSGLLGKYWYIRAGTEYLAAALAHKFYTVNPNVTAMFKKRYWPFGGKFDTLTTWANTNFFKPSPFVLDGTVRLLYAGRTDDFKRLDIMMLAVKSLRDTGAVPVEFHYVGDGDLEKYPEYAAIRDITKAHGRRTGQEVAEIMRSAHIGMLTSEFEGMPRFVIETLASGRPVVALRLPQIEPIVRDGFSGYLVDRTPQMIEKLADRLLDTYRAVEAGTMRPEAVATSVEAYTPTALLAKIFADHRRLHHLPA